jgi:hypothetical protein
MALLFVEYGWLLHEGEEDNGQRQLVVMASFVVAFMLYGIDDRCRNGGNF